MAREPGRIMNAKTLLATAACLVATSAPALGQGAQVPVCQAPAAPQPAAAAPQTQGQLTVTPLPGIIAAGSRFTQVFQTVGNNVDGIVAAADGSLLASQEDNNAVLKIDKDTERRCCSPVSRWGRCRSIDRAASSPSGASRSTARRPRRT